LLLSLKDLHWLQLPERITYKLCALTFRCLTGLAPKYLSKQLQPVADLVSRQRLRSLSTSQLVVPCMRWSATAPLLSPCCVHGTVCLTHRTDCHHWNNSRNIWKLIYLKSHLHTRTVC